MKQFKQFAMVVIGVTVANSSPTYINISDDAYLVIIPRACAEDAISTAPPTSTPPLVQPPAVSTGPWALKSKTTEDCYRLDYINSNGTPAVSPLPWIPCPK